MNRHLEAIEHRGKVYVSLDDMQRYLRGLVDRATGVTGKQALEHVLEQLVTVSERQPVR